MVKTPKQLCEMCEKPIPKARLQALPNVKLCVVCASENEGDDQPIMSIDDFYNAEDCSDIISGDN